MTFFCARCQKRLKPDNYIYSPWTRNRYCAEIDACGKRVRRKAKEAVSS